ncbi:MAG TPA: C4-type zinc ribbon domain-containing protein [Smithellaceae bacterium]|nr:C4-type zinc ribbon domain-containing protein [Smithellaceae bacterium]HQH01137.1 C4-type zinc ribbon domain-containing protein [Smithellaceae bacterium]HQH05502.1 C4-type zinc ribbon domain-containing protein [Smithellaceae bacterium]HQJ76792.1 C4-type zinc ribbon domain-containing protein [Smithellaceae bacterium]
MKEQLLLLIGLQECDSQLVKLAAKKTRLPEEIQAMENDFQAYRESIEQNKQKQEDLKARRAEYEAAIKKIGDGMIKTKGRLLEVKNNKEYQAMLKEIETAEKTLGEMETRIIALMEDMDKLSVLVKQDDAVLAQETRKHEQEKKIIEDDLSAVDADTACWTEKRAELQKQIPADLLNRYERIKKRNNGVGVISVWKAVCSGCHMNIPPQLYNELQRSNELLSCPNCNRIMYFKNQEKAE